MEFLRKLVAALLALFVVLPLVFVTISGVVNGEATMVEIIAWLSVGLAVSVIVWKLWTKDGFHRRIATLQDEWQTHEGHFDVPADLNAKVRLMKYRRTGSFTIPMFRQRVKLWKGASISISSGHVSAPKDWVAEESGDLSITNGHLVYVGARSNRELTWRSIVKMAADQGILEIQQKNRGAIRWQGKSIDARFVAAADLLWRAAN